MALNTTSIVISLASEAGGIGLSASLENRIVPVSASIMKACAALVSKSCAAPGQRRQHGSSKTQEPREAAANAKFHEMFVLPAR